jgi:hypothetical protein
MDDISEKYLQILHFFSSYKIGDDGTSNRSLKVVK